MKRTMCNVRKHREVPQTILVELFVALPEEGNLPKFRKEICYEQRISKDL